LLVVSVDEDDDLRGNPSESKERRGGP
jgi:hypothetical protein